MLTSFKNLSSFKISYLYLKMILKIRVIIKVHHIPWQVILMSWRRYIQIKFKCNRYVYGCLDLYSSTSLLVNIFFINSATSVSFSNKMQFCKPQEKYCKLLFKILSNQAKRIYVILDWFWNFCKARKMDQSFAMRGMHANMTFSK